MSIGELLTPIEESFTLKDHTFKVLRSAILEMDIYDPNFDPRLDERNLADHLAISRTPIREALSRLAHEGLVEIIPRKGVFVCRKSMSEILEIIITWAALESMAARLATSNATDSALEALRQFAIMHSKEIDRANLDEYSDANIKFHQTILELSGCSLLRSTADGLLTHMQAVRRRAMREGNRARRSVVDHMQIIDALTSRNSELAANLVREHTMRLHDHIYRTWTKLEAVA